MRYSSAGKQKWEGFDTGFGAVSTKEPCRTSSSVLSNKWQTPFGAVGQFFFRSCGEGLSFFAHFVIDAVGELDVRTARGNEQGIARSENLESSRLPERFDQ